MNGESRLGVGDVDAVDIAIIGVLQEDGRRSNAAVARTVGVSQTTVKKRIERLVRRGIMRVVAVVDPSAVNHGAHVFMGIKTRPGCVAPVADALAEMHEVAFLACVVGRYDILLELFATDHATLLDSFSDRLAAVPGIESLETFSVLRNQKVNYYNWNLRGAGVRV